MQLQENIPLAPLTTFRLGGPARFFVEAASAADVQQAVAVAESKSLPLFVLGGGSNLVVSDSGWPGLVLKVAIAGIERRPAEEDGKAVIAGGGRYVVIKPQQAEVAFAVVDQYQGQGIGNALLRDLSSLAREAGLQEFVAEVLRENTAMLKVFEKSGLEMTTRSEGQTIHVLLRFA